MPSDKTDAMKERVKFALEWERRWKVAHGGRVDVAELCRMFGITPPTGYLWIARYRAAGHDIGALQERSRRPHSNPGAVPAHVEELIVDARKERPRWGARKLRAWLADRHPAACGRARAASRTFSGGVAWRCRAVGTSAAYR